MYGGGSPAGYLLREARLDAFMNQAEVAERLGVSQSVISRWESGKVDPTFNSVLMFLGATGLNIRVRFDPVNVPVVGRRAGLRVERRQRSVHSEVNWARAQRASKHMRAELRRQRKGPHA
jgi:transcriptional regulator with XRE-family HTH domain